MSLAGQRVWVLGCGFLGSALAGACRAAGARVLTLDSTAPADVCGSAAEAGVLREALSRLVPDAVFCCTATHGGSAADYRRSYVDVAQQLSQQLPSACRLVFCSSSSLYVGGGIVTEESPVHVSSERAEILHCAETLVLEQGGVVARLVPLYGPGRCELVRRYLSGEPCLPGSPQRMLNYLHRDDAVTALLLLAREAAPGVYNVCGESFTKAGIYTRLQNELELPVPQQESAPSARGVSDMQVDCSRLRSLGWKPVRSLVAFANEWKGDRV